MQAGEAGIRFLLVSGQPLEEPVAWYGPIVMNTQEELRQAFETRPGDGRSFLIAGPHSLALRLAGDEIASPDGSFVIQLKTISNDQMTAEVRMWELGPGNRREVRIRELVSAGPGSDLQHGRLVIRTGHER